MQHQFTKMNVCENEVIMHQIRIDMDYVKGVNTKQRYSLVDKAIALHRADIIYGNDYGEVLELLDFNNELNTYRKVLENYYRGEDFPTNSEEYSLYKESRARLFFTDYVYFLKKWYERLSRVHEERILEWALNQKVSSLNGDMGGEEIDICSDDVLDL